MHAYFGQLKDDAYCFSSKIHLALMKENVRGIAAHCFDRPQVCYFGNTNSAFITERYA